MKKELKELIKSKKISDDDLIKLITASQSENETDIMNELEDQNNSEDSGNAEKATANKEQPKKNLTMNDLSKLIATSVAEAMKVGKQGELLPAQKPLVEATGEIVKKEIPKAVQKDSAITIGSFQLMA